jgi:hypothetical protein
MAPGADGRTASAAPFIQITILHRYWPHYENQLKFLKPPTFHLTRAAVAFPEHRHRNDLQYQLVRKGGSSEVREPQDSGVRSQDWLRCLSVRPSVIQDSALAPQGPRIFASQYITQYTYTRSYAYALMISISIPLYPDELDLPEARFLRTHTHK